MVLGNKIEHITYMILTCLLNGIVVVIFYPNFVNF